MHSRRGWLRAFQAMFVGFSLALAGCASPGAGLPTLPAQEVAGEAAYKLAPGDKLRITVFGADDLSGDFNVNDGGFVDLPLIGGVKATGLSARQLSSAIERRLAEGYMRDPKVAVQASAYRPIYIFGEVTRPGEYPYSSNMSVLNAVALGGGYSYRANQNFVVVTREGRDYRADVTARLQPEDVVRVPERYF